MDCPKCGGKTNVDRTIDKKDFVIRFRTCANNKCKHRFKTKELVTSEWNYRVIVQQMKNILKDVSL